MTQDNSITTLKEIRRETARRSAIQHIVACGVAALAFCVVASPAVLAAENNPSAGNSTPATTAGAKRSLSL